MENGEKVYMLRWLQNGSVGYGWLIFMWAARGLLFRISMRMNIPIDIFPQGIARMMVLRGPRSS